MYVYDFMIESKVVVKVEKKLILISFSLWSEEDFEIPNERDNVLFKKRLIHNYGNNFKLNENVETNYKEISIEINS